MEDEKKKRKNKKKKNKQTKTTGEVSDGMVESGNADQNQAPEQNDRNVQNDVLKTDADLDTCQANGTEGFSLQHRIKNFEKENDTHMQKEVSLEEIIKYLQKENDTHLQKEARLEETIQYLQKENDTHLQKEDRLKETIQYLQKENDTHLQKEASLEETIKYLQKENDTRLQKEASLEMKLSQLHIEKDSWLQKEADFEEKINRLMDETTTWSVKGVSLEGKIKQLERERDCWVQKENSCNETIASLNGENTRLQAQVMELGELRNSLLQENQLLTESMFDLQSQIVNLKKSVASSHASRHTSGSEDMNAMTEASQKHVEQLVSENAEIVEKVNGLNAELDQRGVTADLSPAVGSELAVGTAQTIRVLDPTAEFREKINGQIMNSQEDVLNKDERNCSDNDHANKDERNWGGNEHTSNDVVGVADHLMPEYLSSEQLGSLEDVVIKAEVEGSRYDYGQDTAVRLSSPVTIDSGEIVQIPLDENEDGNQQLQSIHNDQEEMDVSLTDAPLTGAPFRLITFVARYVSGADLVNKSSVKSGTLNSHN